MASQTGFNIQDFRNNISQGGVLQNNKFVVTITPIGLINIGVPQNFSVGDLTGEFLQFRAEEVKLPGASLEVFNNHRYGLGIQQKFPTNINFTDLNVTFLEDNRGRIYPTRIEEVVERVKSEVDDKIKETGERTVMDMGLSGIHPELVRLIGRLKYRTSYGQNILQHSIEVANLAGMIAGELGLDSVMFKRAGLLHDIGKAVDHEIEGTHPQIGADLVKKYKESPRVISAVGDHHGDDQLRTIDAIIVQAADSISGARPGARRESLETYIKRLEKLENIAESFTGVKNSFAMQAGREIRIMVEYTEINDAQALQLAKDIAKRIEEEVEYPGQVKVTVIREMRASEYAK